MEDVPLVMKVSVCYMEYVPLVIKIPVVTWVPMVNCVMCGCFRLS